MKNQTTFFENYARKGSLKTSSDRSFGLVFAIACIVMGVIYHWPVWWKGVYWFLAGGGFFLTAFFFPHLLRPFNKLWTEFGLLLHKLTNPIIMGILFYGLFTPMGMIAKIFRWDPLNLKFKKEIKTYWIERGSEGSGSLKNQF